MILSSFKNDEVTWLTDESAVPLIQNNPFIKRILIWGIDTMLQVMFERFDVVVNLEKTPGYCALADKIEAWQKYGFRFDREVGRAEAYKESLDALATYNNIEMKRNAMRPWQEILFEMIDRKWDGEEYILNHIIESNFWQVGLNFKVGQKWPNKTWPHDKWMELYGKLIGNTILVSWQQGETDLNDYIKWISRCECIVTNDSLGLHLAIAMKKKVLVLLGPTSPHEIYLYERGSKIVAPNICGKAPCLQPKCDYIQSCMSMISVDIVYHEINRIIKDNTKGDSL